MNIDQVWNKVLEAANNLEKKHGFKITRIKDCPEAYFAHCPHHEEVFDWPKHHKTEHWKSQFKNVISQISFTYGDDKHTEQHILLILEDHEESPKFFSNDPDMIVNYSIAFTREHYYNVNDYTYGATVAMPEVYGATRKLIKSANYGFNEKSFQSNAHSKYSMARINKKFKEFIDHNVDYQRRVAAFKSEMEVRKNETKERKLVYEMLEHHFRHLVADKSAEFSITPQHDYSELNFKVKIDPTDVSNLSKLIGQDVVKLREIYEM